jgi:hypothetical protein
VDLSTEREPGGCRGRLPRDVAGGKQTTGDVTTLENLNVLAALRSNEEWPSVLQGDVAVSADAATTHPQSDSPP